MRVAFLALAFLALAVLFHRKSIRSVPAHVCTVARMSLSVFVIFLMFLVHHTELGRRFPAQRSVECPRAPVASPPRTVHRYFGSSLCYPKFLRFNPKVSVSWLIGSHDICVLCPNCAFCVLCLHVLMRLDL